MPGHPSRASRAAPGRFHTAPGSSSPTGMNRRRTTPCGVGTGTRSSRSRHGAPTSPPRLQRSPATRGTSRTSRASRCTPRTTRRAPTRGHRSSNPPRPATTAATPGRRRHARRPCAPPCRTARRSSGRVSSGGPATPPIASGIGCRASRSPRAVPCSCRTHQSCACRSSTSTIWQRSSPPSAPQASAARSTRSGIRRRFPRCSRPHARHPEIACRWRASTASSSASTCTPL